MSKTKTASDEKFTNQDLDLFEVLNAVDQKNYSYYDSLTIEQQKKLIPFVLLHWISAVKASNNVQVYYLLSTEYHANVHMFNENVQKHPKLQWLMLCSASPGLGKQFHQWIPTIRDKVRKLKESPKYKEIADFFKKIYTNASDSDISMLADAYMDSHYKKKYLADKFPHIKYDDIEVLAELISKHDISVYENECGD